MGLRQRERRAAASGTIRFLTCVLPPAWAGLFLFVQSPVLMVQIGGGVFLVAVVIVVWRLLATGVDERWGRPSGRCLARSGSAVRVGRAAIFLISK
ncbi:hypothetical protein ACFWOJ_39080 [Streptomyces sp. NPDC058439]|uniref:hypothetical protein n=1 Tax=Streptomyces sp. NPDC058439 TaxID=3346500 RepID=UPI00365DD96D